MIKFKEEDIFFKELNKKVRVHFVKHEISPFANRSMKLKIVVLFTGLITSYMSIYSQSSSFLVTLFFAFIYGFFTFLIAFNVVHDAGHNALFKSKRWNEISLLCLDIFGISSFLWKTNHNLHHRSPNVLHHDSLVDDFKLGKIVPGRKNYFIYRLQAAYIPILSLVYSISLFLVSDFVKFRRLAEGLTMFQKRLELLKMIGSKLFAIFFTVLLPMWYFDLTAGQVVLFFLCIHLGPGIMVGFFIAPSHFNTHLDYPEPDSSGSIESSWGEHQLRTTEDFATQSLVFNFLLGGFNHHVAHHLFPHICHIHYPQITPIIKQTAKDFGIPYHHSSFADIYSSHLLHLVKMSRPNTQGSSTSI